MTAVPQPRTGHQERIRVLEGRRRSRVLLGPWAVVALIAISGFLGLGFAQTSLDRAAFELAELEKSINEAEAANLELKLEMARLENPARIAPLAEEMGLVLPATTNQLLVDLDQELPVFAGAEREESNQ